MWKEEISWKANDKMAGRYAKFGWKCKLVSRNTKQKWFKKIRQDLDSRVSKMADDNNNYLLVTVEKSKIKEYISQYNNLILHN